MVPPHPHSPPKKTPALPAPVPPAQTAPTAHPLLPELEISPKIAKPINKPLTLLKLQKIINQDKK